jgi:hypothetical protein
MAEDNSKKKDAHRHSHCAYGYRREGKKWGRLLECGTGYLDFAESSVEDIAAKFEGVPVDADVVREILENVAAHLFIDRQVYVGATGYFCLRTRKERLPPWVEEREPEAFEGPLPPEKLR